MNTNWFGMEPHPSDEFVPLGLSKQETAKLAYFLRERYDAIIVDRPELKLMLDEMLDAAESSGFNRGWEAGIDHLS